DQSGAISDASTGGLFAQQRIKSYAQVANSPGVTDRVAEKLGLAPAELAGKVTAAVPVDTVLLNPWAGIPVFLAVVWLLFELTTRFAAPLQGVIGQIVDGPVASEARPVDIS
ncbi:hypothetical protein B4Q13_23085, partial [Lacticaseibacillus rhamnosus]